MKNYNNFLIFERNNKKYFLRSGEFVRLIPSHIHVGIRPHLEEVLSQIDSDEKQFIKKEIKFDHVIGLSHCVDVDETDTIYYKTRGNRRGESKMVANREPEPCSSITIILLKKKNSYMLLSAYIGKIAEPEIWDTKNFNKSEDPIEAERLANKYWETRALIDEE